MVTYNGEMQVYKFRPPYSGWFRWSLRLVLLLAPLSSAIMLIIIWKLNLANHEDIFAIGMTIALFIPALFMVVAFKNLIYVTFYLPEKVILTYDQIIIKKDPIGLVKTRIPLFEITAVSIDSTEKSTTIPILRSLTDSSPFSDFIFRIDGKAYRVDKKFLVRIVNEKRRIYEFQIQSPDVFVRLVREKIKEFRPQYRV